MHALRSAFIRASLYGIRNRASKATGVRQPSHHSACCVSVIRSLASWLHYVVS